MLDTKVCTKCGVEKSVDGFYKDRSRKCGLHSNCKACNKEKDRVYHAENSKALNEHKRVYRADNSEALNEYSRVYRADNSESIKEMNRVYRLENPDGVRARAAIGASVKRGDTPAVATLLCITCESPAQQYHHTDMTYAPENNLVVVALCRSCHKREHSRLDQLGQGVKHSNQTKTQTEIRS